MPMITTSATNAGILDSFLTELESRGYRFGTLDELASSQLPQKQPRGFDANKMPIGMQLIGPRFGEQKLLNAGLAFEQASGLKNIIAAL